MIIEHNATTGEITQREATAEEVAQQQADQAVHEARQTAEVQKAADKAALLEKLGINEDEARLLLG
jgi:hypothetical protein